MYHFYFNLSKKKEYCFNVETEGALNEEEVVTLKYLLSEGFLLNSIQDKTTLESGDIIEIGPRLNFATAFSTNAVNVCHACGLKQVIRVERSRRYLLDSDEDRSIFLKSNHDRMTECEYEETLQSFETGVEAESVFIVPLKEEREEALRKINQDMGLGMDDWDISYYYDLFVNKIGRNPTNVECFQLGQANSEHSRHWFFKGKLIIDKKEIEENLFEIVQAPYKNNKNNSIIAFSDNSSAIKGYGIQTIIPSVIGKASPFKTVKSVYNPVLTAETHNFPTGVAPFPGAETGAGGRLRDQNATGKGSLVLAGTSGYCVGNLNIPNYELPWEDKNFKYPTNLASPLKIEIDASNGASDYGNKFGEPLIQGFTRSFGLTLPGGERKEWLKPIMFSGGVGQIDKRHIDKEKPEKGMLIIQIGGPAYRIGMGGGAASSMIQGENAEELDFNAVQRGDAEMEQKMNRVIRACVELGNDNPIISIHDQGAGGPCNVVTEIVEPVGGKIEIRNIKVGDKTLSVLEIWGAEYQERDALLINPERLNDFRAICERERSDFEVLGEVTGDGKIVVHDSKDDSTPVDLELEKILGKMPQKTFEDNHKNIALEPLKIPENLDFKNMLNNVLRLLSVGSKGFLVRKVDRSVTGLIAQQQCAGPMQLTVSNVSVVAQSHFNKTGTAISIGEQPIKMVVNQKAGARMSVGETLTNIVWARISSLEDIKCSGNWMWAAKLPGEGANIYDAAKAMSDMMVELGIAIDGGKDSLSMAAKVGETIVKSPGELTISAYATVPDITKVITPDIKKPGESNLWFVDLARGKCRMGGSALAQTLKQIGNESPDIDDVAMFKKSFLAIQEMIDKDVLLSGHDRSDGGLVTTMLEMAFAGNCGIDIKINNSEIRDVNYLFNEELGLVLEIEGDKEGLFKEILEKYNLASLAELVGATVKEDAIKIEYNGKNVLTKIMSDLRQTWEETSFQMELIQNNPENAKEEKENIYQRKNPQYNLTFEPLPTDQSILEQENKPRVAIVREEGSNGDREMTSAFYLSGFEPWDVSMNDLLGGEITLDQFRGVVFVGGFSYADVLGSAKGWASTIRFNEELNKMFNDFYNRKDTFSLGVCNGCQLMGLLGWVPWQGIDDEMQPRFVRNKSERFESRWVSTKVQSSPSIMLSGMENSVLGVWIAHGEGRLNFPDQEVLQKVKDNNLVPLVYTDDEGNPTEKYPFNPNGSVGGITGICSEDGRHLAMMPHPERAFLTWQWPWMSEEWKKELKASPWLKMFQNAREWCENN